MSYIVDFKNVSTVGLESSPAAEALAGLRANEARYFMNNTSMNLRLYQPASPARPLIM